MNIDINIDPKTGNYFPTIFFNEFWLLREKLVAVNATVTELMLDLEVGPIGLTKWQIFLQMDQSFQIHRNYGSMLEGEADIFSQLDDHYRSCASSGLISACSLSRGSSWRETLICWSSPCLCLCYTQFLIS